MLPLHDGPEGEEVVRRHPAFQDLSRDHFTALNHVVDVRRVVTADRFAKEPATVRSGFVRLVQQVLPGHFREEEELLAPWLGSPARSGHRTRLLQEHEGLRSAFAGLGEATGMDRLWEVAQAIQAHIRWEEDDLFERMQLWLTEEELAGLAERSRAFRVQAGMPVGPGGKGDSCPPSRGAVP